MTLPNSEAARRLSYYLFGNTMMTPKAPVIYLDHNTLIDVMNDRIPAFSQAIHRANQTGARFAYSPAHIEEIANINRSKASDEDCGTYVQNHLNFIAHFTDCWEFLPSDSGTAVLKQEHPVECMKRVIEQYERTYIAEDVEDALREYVPPSSTFEIASDAFEHEPLKSIFLQRLRIRGHTEDDVPRGSNLRMSHKMATEIIDICFRSIHYAGIGLERKGKTRSAIHDVTHAIYGVFADIFISRDIRLLKKVKAAYKMLRAECIPMSPEEFIAQECD